MRYNPPSTVILEVYLEKVCPSENMHRFWQCWVLKGTSQVFWRWGRIGTSGQKMIKQCSGSEVAEALAEEMIRSKIRGGYVEIDAPLSVSSGPSKVIKRYVCEACGRYFRGLDIYHQCGSVPTGRSHRPEEHRKSVTRYIAVDELPDD